MIAPTIAGHIMYRSTQNAGPIRSGCPTWSSPCSSAKPAGTAVPTSGHCSSRQGKVPDIVSRKIRVPGMAMPPNSASNPDSQHTRARLALSTLSPEQFDRAAAAAAESANGGSFSIPTSTQRSSATLGGVASILSFTGNNRYCPYLTLSVLNRILRCPNSR